jgi:hypothetical protein
MTGTMTAPRSPASPPLRAVYTVLGRFFGGAHPLTLGNHQKRPQRECVGMSGAVTMTLLKMRVAATQTNNSEVMRSKEN